MNRGRLLSLVTALLAVLVLAVVAPVLETTPIASPYETPGDADGAGGGSLVPVLYALVFALLGLLGIESEPVGSLDGSPVAALLEAVIPLLPTLGSLLVVGIVLASLFVAARRLPVSGIFSDQFVARWRPAKTDDSGPADVEWPLGEPDPGVAEAWLALTATVDPDHPTALTPAEWAKVAADEGLDDDAVADLTHLFRETRYGGADETPEHCRRAKHDLERLEGDPK